MKKFNEQATNYIKSIGQNLEKMKCDSTCETKTKEKSGHKAKTKDDSAQAPKG
jgi:hypothetical protein